MLRTRLPKPGWTFHSVSITRSRGVGDPWNFLSGLWRGNMVYTQRSCNRVAEHRSRDQVAEHRSHNDPIVAHVSYDNRTAKAHSDIVLLDLGRSSAILSMIGWSQIILEFIFKLEKLQDSNSDAI